MTISELERRIDSLEHRVNSLQSAVNTLANKVFIQYTLSPFDYIGDGTILGDLMTINHFAECVHNESFIDYDGYGYFATKTEQSDILVMPSNFWLVRPHVPPELTHVIWFNK